MMVAGGGATTAVAGGRSGCYGSPQVLPSSLAVSSLLLISPPFSCSKFESERASLEAVGSSKV